MCRHTSRVEDRGGGAFRMLFFAKDLGGLYGLNCVE